MTRPLFVGGMSELMELGRGVGGPVVVDQGAEVGVVELWQEVVAARLPEGNLQHQQGEHEDQGQPDQEAEPRKKALAPAGLRFAPMLVVQRFLCLQGVDCTTGLVGADAVREKNAQRATQAMRRVETQQQSREGSEYAPPRPR